MTQKKRESCHVTTSIRFVHSLLRISTQNILKNTTLFLPDTSLTT